MKDSQTENNAHLDSQRAELERMSNSLIFNLQKMIDEQTKRAKSLASQQHSLSALPNKPSIVDITPTHTIPVILEPIAKVTPQASNVKESVIPQSLPPIPQQSRNHPAPKTTPPRSSSTKTENPHQPKVEWPWKAEKKQKNEEGFGLSTIIVILVIGFLMTVCSS